MKSQQELNYNRIADAIRFIKKNYRTQPKLEEIAEHINMSPFHFQRMFSEWAGTTPKRFLQYLNIEYAKKILKETHATLFDTACELGLSGTGRLHDLFINIEGMTPGEYKNGGLALNINYSFADTPFGKIIAASTDKGVCHMAFVDEGERRAFDHLRSIFSNAKYVLSPDTKQQHALSVFDRDWNRLEEIKLHLKGTEFQLKVWETLLKIPAGGLATYADLATKSGYNGACRAVGTAVGKNPVAFLIPCHRVIKATGEPGNYHWGEMRKNAIIAWEAAHKDFPDR
ncbi:MULTISPECIES: methylated-DNA--[protein]-cysteine S-methyltransferase [Bacteroides]|jgi:AraC family transcriptional regulator of adaptative response/methylated-DNA-[protein]-cysteine methyltransferase|uniref:Cysteine methyltransferase n=1 Tax=Bacteroides fragilis TaxID=817 RepID=A0A0I9UNC6_BACFG|nr:methylated-DNA--[protein]-cysteine S-methyltransferase [Bacteroides fragilis]MCE8568118.1 methylated-DNA--[protein]-cysteine S-methyltransferase [Bacteroides fragilis]MCM0193932.1 methylated-DNA--[protein]-cysteine S-methyltransferase [Bacteroides fragilis]MCM0201152.1 methylated-DNA--[protein]-cysteine S-methyltransferase [Bacteroides fragilis]MCM0211853.1 methylated-DNA--[protein]-cysteine S-methyltransferase [Bacteroides fragilis]MCM0216274.1 methylated-DNA--[protein]-cysteine S-methyltr